MPAYRGRLLVIDACIAASASSTEPGVPPGSVARQFLIAVFETGHLAAMTNELIVEWNNHQSRFARTWRLNMAQRGRIRMLGAARYATLRRRILATISDKDIAAIVRKDLHLVQGALDADRVVVSYEKRLRYHLRNLCTEFAELRSLTWVNPELETDLGNWLQRGAPPEPDRIL